MVFVIAFLVFFLMTDCNPIGALFFMLLFFPALLLIWAVVEFLKSLLK